MNLKDKLIIKKNSKEFIDVRNKILKCFYVLISISYSIFWYFKHPIDSPAISVYLTCLFSPQLMIGYYYRVYYYIFIYNWYYILYMLFTIITFYFILFNTDIITLYYDRYVSYEFIHAVLIIGLTISISVLVSFPFKLIHHLVLDSKKLYYKGTIIDDINKLNDPSVNTKYEYMNETELNVELNNALNEERYEDAEKIKKILETKFR